MNRAEVYVGYFKKFYEIADERCRKYWGTDRPNGQAAGLESLVHFGGMLVGRPGKITVIDAGAGASSAILRTYFSDVVTCDPDGEYLEQVRAACVAMGLPPGRWVEGLPDVECDACFYDYGTRDRGPSFPHFLDRTKHLVWVDDAHDFDLLKTVDSVCLSRGLDLKLARCSLDEHGRFGAFVVKS